jgi:trehalose 6-phosphate synthase/phosphatase
MKENKFWEVKFKFNYPKDSADDIRIVGNIESLGMWNIDKAIKLNYEPKKECWETKSYIKIPTAFDLEYKYLIFKDNVFIKEEEINQKRKVAIPEQEKLILSADKDSPETKIQKHFVKMKKSSKDVNGKIHLKSALKNGSKKNNTKLKETKKTSIEFNLNENKDKEEDNSSNEDNPLFDTEDSLDYNSFEGDEPIQNWTSPKEEGFNDNDDIIMCSTYVPFNPVREKDGSINFVLTNESIYHTLYRVIQSKKNIKWFGNLKYLKKLNEADRKDIIERLKKKNIFIFDIEESIYHKVLRLTEEVLEPLFHYTPFESSIMDDFNSIMDHWKAYTEYNESVSKQISKHLTKNSLIYLNDINFLLVPNFLYSLRKHDIDILQNLAIGIFFHSPFPCFDVFKRIPIREEILRSILKCRVIGFHTFDCSRNFLKSAKRLLSCNYVSTPSGDLAVNYHEFTSLIRVKNISPEIGLLKEDIKEEEFKKYYNEIKSKYGHKKNIFVSVEHMQFLLSIKNKLDGYAAFLRELREKSKKNVFLLYIRYFDQKEDQNIDYHIEHNRQKMIDKIDELVLDIKKEFGDDVIELYKGKITYIHRLALFAASNVFVRSSKQESYSLGLYEFLIIKKLLKQNYVVTYMLSELSGVNTSLGATIKINPFDMNSLKRGFLDASQQISETTSQYLIALEKDFNHAMKSSCKDWFFSFVSDVKNSKFSDENTLYIGADEGLNFKLSQINPDFKKLNLKQIEADYEKSNKRLLFFDFEGTLPAAYQNSAFLSKDSPPSAEIISLLKGLTSDKRNRVFIVAGKGPKELKEWFEGVRNLGLAAEHGFKYCINKHGNEHWKKIIKNYDNAWIKNCSDIISPYLERCEGSVLDVKESSIVWQYTDCDQELGKQFASALTSELENIILKYNLKILNGKGYIEIIARGVDKGYFVGYKIKEYIRKKNGFDFILCIGDDTSDEKMFDYLIKKKDEIKKYCKQVKIYGVTVGKKPSKAKFYVEKPKNVQEIITGFVRASNKLSSSISTIDIRGFGLNNKFRISKEDEDNNISEENDTNGRNSLDKK